MPAPDYPQMAAVRGRIEPAPRRVRGFLGHELVFDTTVGALRVGGAVLPAVLHPARRRPRRVPARRGPSAEGAVRSVAAVLLVGAGQTHESAARVFDDGDGAVAGLVRFEWDALTGSRRTSRSTAIRAIRTRGWTRCAHTATSRVELDGVTLADTAVRCCSSKPVCRQGITSTGPMSPSSTWSRRHADAVPVQGGRRRATGRCGSATRCTPTSPGRYHYPLPAVAPIAGMVAFYNEKVDITVDGVKLARPQTHFGKRDR